MYKITLSIKAEQDLATFLKVGSKSTLKKINTLFDELRIHPKIGTGKPEQLKGDLSGYWSRRIDSKNRIIYKILDKVVVVEILSLKGHYYDK